MTNTQRDLLQRGLADHQAGRLDAAETAYRAVLSVDPSHPDALHLLALIRHARNDHADAVSFAERAVAAAPGIANFHNTLGNSLRNIGRVDEAMLALAAALRLDPRHAFAWHNLALCHESRNELAAARDCDQRALQVDPNYADALIHALRLSQLADDQVAAAGLHDQLLAQFAPTAAALAASYTYRVNVASRAIAAGDLDRAAAFAGPASELVPNRHEAWIALGEVANRRLDFALAERHLATAAHLAPEHEGARLAIATFLLEQRRFDEAELHYRAWWDRHPDSARAEFGLAWVALAQGRYREGWRRYEVRWSHPDHASPRFIGAPPWEGEATGHLLLYAEQGLGDAVMMLRFVADVLARPIERVTLLVPPPLLRLGATLSTDPRWSVINRLDDASDIDAACPLMSLPRVLGVDSAEQLARPPYLHADSARAEHYRARLAAVPGRKIGLVWSGGPASLQNGRRRLPEEVLTPLFAVPGWSVVSLQVGKPARVADQTPIDLAAEIEDFFDLAAAMAAVDVVISVDSGPAHLAGALGRPCFMLLPWLYDWRWPSTGECCDWYASLRIVRQRPDGDWTSAMSSCLGGLESPC